MLLRLSFFSSCILLLLTTASCGGGGGGDTGPASECGVLNARIFNGETCDQVADTPVLPMLAIDVSGQEFRPVGSCTGALVTVNDFVTSAHCFVRTHQQFGVGNVAFGVQIGGSDGEILFVSRFAVHPFYNGVTGSPFDIAMATLERVPNPPIGPLPLIFSEPTLPGDTVTAFGYGTSNDGDEGVLKAADITIDGLSGGNLIGTLTTSGASICQGDSGGPLVKTVGGVTGLVGVNSFVTATTAQCGGAGSLISGFVDTQFPTIAEFITSYAPDVAVR